MTVIITTLAIGADYKRCLKRCLESKKEYAEKHGYKYILGDEVYWDRTRPIAWSKIPFLLKVCETIPDGTLVWQSDADVLITNMNLRVEDHVAPLLPKEKDLLLTKDACGSINTGNMLFRNGPWFRGFLKRAFEQTQFTYHIWWEQAAMIYLLETVPTDAAKIEVSKEHKRFNAFLRGQPGEGLWVPGDFLVHFAGVGNDKQIQELTEACLAGKTPRISM
jgi:hypothetical protein